MKAKYIIMAALAAGALCTSCDKVSPQGVLMAGTAVEDRVKMSHLYYKEYLNDYEMNLDTKNVQDGEYTFLVGADSHITDDPGRLDEMLKIGLDGDDLLYAHLGDIADTKPEYYIVLDSALQKAKERFVRKNYVQNEYGRSRHKNNPYDIIGWDYNEIHFPFFPVVGNHDLTHNGWAMWCSLFHSSFYEFDVCVGTYDDGRGTVYDHFIFLDTASGTLGKTQIDLINQGVLDGNYFDDETGGFQFYRHTFVFSHTNIFRPSSMQFASTFSREETFFLLNQFEEWNASIVFCGHVHAWDEREYNKVNYLTLDSMSERNSPKPGDYLLRVHVHKDGSLTWERVHMDYVAQK